MPKSRYIFLVRSTRISKIRTLRFVHFALYNSLAWLILRHTQHWSGDSNSGVTMVELNLYCCYADGCWFDSLLGWLRATQHCDCITKTRSE